MHTVLGLIESRAKVSHGQAQQGHTVRDGRQGGRGTSSEPAVSASESKASEEEITLVKTSSWGS